MAENVALLTLVFADGTCVRPASPPPLAAGGLGAVSFMLMQCTRLLEPEPLAGPDGPPWPWPRPSRAGDPLLPAEAEERRGGRSDEVRHLKAIRTLCTKCHVRVRACVCRRTGVWIDERRPAVGRDGGGVGRGESERTGHRDRSAALEAAHRGHSYSYSATVNECAGGGVGGRGGGEDGSGRVVSEAECRDRGLLQPRRREDTGAKRRPKGWRARAEWQ